MTEDAYRGFAGRYDLFFPEFGRHSPVEVEFFRELFSRSGVASVLDCACGTGHDLVMFHALGVEVSGSDRSGAMLERAHENLARLGLEIPLAKVDYRELPARYSGGFDCVVCLSTSILEVGDEQEVRRALGSMHGVLRDGGLLVLSQGTSDKQWSGKPRFMVMVDRPDFSRIMVIDYLGRGARYNVLDLFHGEGRSDLRVWSHEYPVMLLRDDYDSLLKSAGYRDIDFYGDYAFEAYDKTRSDMLIAIATK